MGLRGIANKYTFLSFGIELRQTDTFDKNVALAPEDVEVGDVRLPLNEKLVGSLLEEAMEVEAV